MKTLIIDAVNEKIFLVIITSQNVYTNSYKNSKSNFDKLTILINEFLKKKSMSIEDQVVLRGLELHCQLLKAFI